MRSLNFPRHQDKLYLIGLQKAFLTYSHPEMIKKSFSVCGITTHNPQNVRNEGFLRRIMQNVNEKIHEEEEGLLEKSDKDSLYNM